MSDSSNRWMHKLGRSKSETPEVPLMRSSPPPSAPIDTMPPDFVPPPPPPPPDSTTKLTLTPPKKTWEKHYRSFLSKRVLGASPKSTVSNDDDSSGRSGKFPGSRRLFRTKSSGSNATLNKASAIPDMPNLTQSKSNEDMAIRGGNFFASVFNRAEQRTRTTSDGESTSNHHQVVKTSQPQPHVHPHVQSKIKSMDSLDSTLRGGHDKMYSPKNQRFLAKPAFEGEVIHGGIPASPKPIKGHLPSALKSQTMNREMKKAFTEFHNSSRFNMDSSSPYLGDDPSTRPTNYLAMPKQTSTGAQSERNIVGLLSRKESSSLPTVNEDDVVFPKSIRMLKPVQGPESWEEGRRYLIAPAALSSCPLAILRTISQQDEFVDNYTDAAFGTISLGAATVKYVGRHDWAQCRLLLKQNYLLEYDLDSSLTSAPRGFAHLQYSRAYPHADFPNALELEFYASPCARSDKRVLFIRVPNREDRDRWVMCLNDSAQLTIRDLYDYDEETEFGRGRYAMVHPARRVLGKDKKGEPVALKIIDKNEFWCRVLKGMERADTIVRETSVQATLTAKCSKVNTFLRIRGIFETSDHFVIELELLEGKDLFQHISSKSLIEEEEAAQIMRDILVSLDTMSRIGVAHRDIKPANILMCNRERSGVTVKVADFGMSGFAGMDGKLRGRCGTPGYVAPEMWTTGIHGGYGNKVDVFSAGVTLYVLLCGYEPFYGESDAELIASNKAAIIDFPDEDWSRVSSEARELVEKMMKRDPKERISAKEALEHPWMVSRSTPNACSLEEQPEGCTIS